MDGSMFIGTWWSLVPPLLAIVLALVTKDVYSSLFIGVAMGALLYTGFHPWNAFVAFFDIMKNSMNLNILIFDVLLGMIIVLMSKSGGSAAYGKWAGTKIKSKKSAMLATTGLGVLSQTVTRYPEPNWHILLMRQQHRSALSRRFQAGRQLLTLMFRKMRESADFSFSFGRYHIICTQF